MSFVWVAYTTASKQHYVQVSFVENMTVSDAIDKSGLTDLPDSLICGIFGEKVKLSQPLIAGDRVEIYRPLLINPKDIRRSRAKKHPVGLIQKSDRLKRLL